MQVTIGIATWNRAALLQQTLASLAALDVPRGTRATVVVADNNSTDDTKAVVDALQPRLSRDVALDYLLAPTQGKSHALNAILNIARGEWLLLLDDDVLVKPDWLKLYLRAMDRYPRAGCLGGGIEPSVHGKLTRTGKLLLDHYPAVFGALDVAQDQPMAPPDKTAYGANMALRMDAVPDGGYDTERGMIGDTRVAGEDMVIQTRIMEAGHEGWLIGGADVAHYTDAANVNRRWFWNWHKAVGATWLARRGSALEGRKGIPHWHWREAAKRWLYMAYCWTPWPNVDYYDAMMRLAQYWGWLEQSRKPQKRKSRE